MRIRTKLLLFIVPIMFLTVIGSYIASYFIGITVIDSQINQKFNSVRTSETAIIQQNIDSAGELVKMLAVIVEHTYDHEDLTYIENLFGKEISDEPFVLGAGVWFEPFVYDSEERYVGPYIYKSKGELAVTYEYSNNTYDYLNQPYYLMSKDKAQVSYTDVYLDVTSGMYMITCTFPMFGKDKQYIGCVTVDIELTSLLKMVTDYNEKYDGQVFIINGDGTYVAAAEEEKVKERQNITTATNSTLQAAAKRIIVNKKGMERFIENGKEMRLYYDTLSEVDWKIIYKIPESVITQPRNRLSFYFILIGFFSFGTMVVMIMIVAKKYVDQPISLLLEEFKSIGEMKYSNLIAVKLKERNDEYGLLGRELILMKDRLKQFQDDLEESVEENTTMNEELIQQNDQLVENEERLLAAQNYIYALVEAMPDLIFVLSKDGMFMDFKGNKDELMIPEENFIGHHAYDIMPKEIADQGLEKIKKAIETKEPQILEYELSFGDQTGYYEMRIMYYTLDQVIAIIRDIKEKHEKLEEIAYLSYHDQMTGLHNRRYFDQKTKEGFLPEQYPISVIMSDVNGLKMMNDSFGHQDGDTLLKKYARVLQKSKRNNDIIARIGGDEFVLILFNRKLESANEYIKILQKACEKETINGIALSVSFGAAVARSSEEDINQVLKKAEDMMYQNKMYESGSRQGKSIDLIIKTLQAKDPKEEIHSKNVALIAEKIGVELGMSSSELHKLKSAALLHDIGKIGIPEELLNKVGSLTDEEYQLICKHTEIGYRILQSAANMSELSEYVLFHHERWDGAGYPRGLKGIKIPIQSRIIAVADAFDALTSNRSYKETSTKLEAMEELKRSSGSQFDGKIVRILEGLVEKNYL